MKGSFGYWVYRLFVVRGLFEFADSVNEEEIGEIFIVRLECAFHFVFKVEDLRWVGTLPVLCSDLSRWNRELLKRMGCEEWGFSAHWSGYVI